MGTAPGVGLLTAPLSLVLTAPLSLVREPLRLTLRVWAFGLSTAAEGARLALELLDPDRGEGEPDFARRSPSPEPEYGGNGAPAVVTDGPPVVTDAPPVVTEAPPVVTDAPPPVPDELIPDHVDEEVVLVAEAAEAGAEEGAGPELHVDPPWDDYDHMTADDIRARLSAGSATEAAAVELYESTGKARRSVLDAAERALRNQRR
jgi:hypothetical protein